MQVKQLPTGIPAALQIGGVTTKEINALELEMLRLLEYRAFVGRPQIQQQLRAMQVSLGVREAAADARRSKKRVSEDVDSPLLEHFLPVKFQHDLHHSQVPTLKPNFKP